MENNKAAGPDGMVATFNDFHKHTIDLKSRNYGIITLVPKGPDVDKIKKYSPICLL
jgi:hypothetical protein